MGFALDPGVFVDNDDPLSFPFLELNEVVIEVASQEMFVTSAKVKLRMVILYSYSVTELDIREGVYVVGVVDQGAPGFPHDIIEGPP